MSEFTQDLEQCDVRDCDRPGGMGVHRRRAGDFYLCAVHGKDPPPPGWRRLNNE